MANGLPPPNPLPNPPRPPRPPCCCCCAVPVSSRNRPVTASAMSCTSAYLTSIGRGSFLESSESSTRSHCLTLGNTSSGPVMYSEFEGTSAITFNVPALLKLPPSVLGSVALLREANRLKKPPPVLVVEVVLGTVPSGNR